MKEQRAWLLAAILVSSPMGVTAASGPTEKDDVVGTAGFLAHHPDIDFRNRGMRAFAEGRFEEASVQFLRAARFADKASQAMLAEMHWEGQGVAQDRVLAYAWMDLAAERMYPMFLARRERYWLELDATERGRVIDVGEPLYSEYGDAAAKPRLERRLRIGRRNVTGSRVGFVGALQIYTAGPTGETISINGTAFYAPEFWQADRYWEWTDAIFTAPVTGRVEVGEPAAEANAQAAPDPEPLE